MAWRRPILQRRGRLGCRDQGRGADHRLDGCAVHAAGSESNRYPRHHAGNDRSAKKKINVGNWSHGTKRKSNHPRVAPELVPASSSLHGMGGATTGLEFRTDVMGDLAIIQSERPGMGAGPEETAYGLFADFINAVKG